MKRSGVRPSVRPSVCPIRPLQQRAAGLLLWTRTISDIARLLHGRRRGSKCGQCHVVTADVLRLALRDLLLGGLPG